MTISNETNRIQYNGNGVTTAFAFPYYFFATSDLVVILTDTTTSTDTTQVIGTDYTASGTLIDGVYSSGGTITFNTAPASGKRITIYRELTYTQETDYTNADSFPEETHEQALDRLTILTQQIKDDLERSLLLPTSTTLSGLTIPSPEANKYLGWNATANNLENKINITGTTIPSYAGNANRFVRINGTATDLTYYDLFGGSDAFTGNNKIINGNFDVWQRNTTFTTPASLAYTADRWLIAYDGTIGTFTASKQAFTLGQSSVPNNPAFYFNWNHTVAGSGSTVRQIQQRIEKVETLNGSSVSMSFWAKADSARTVSGILRQNFGTGGSPSAAVDTSLGSFSLTTSWQKFTATVSLPSVSGKTLGSNINDYLALIFSLPLNVVMSIDIAQVQLEAGTLATAYDLRTFVQEWLACQRYYEKSFPYATAPAQNSGDAGYIFLAMPTSLAPSASVYYRAIKRASPTLTTYNPSAANNNWRNLSSGADIAVSVQYNNEIAAGIGASAGPAANALIGIHWSAEAEL